VDRFRPHRHTNRDGHPVLVAPYTAPGNPVLSLQAAGDGTMVPTGEIMAQHNCEFWDAANPPAS
jgi:hypothetical protein